MIPQRPPQKKRTSVLRKTVDSVTNAFFQSRYVFLLALLPVIGMFGFHFIEGWTLFDSLYMSMITLTTVGFGEVYPLTTWGRAFVIVYLIGGIGIFSLSILRLGEAIVRFELRNMVERRRMKMAIEALTSHYIVCGFGRMGLALCRQLSEKEIPFVVIDKAAKSLEECQRYGWLHVVGDATDDRILEAAGIERARGLAAVLSSDADNVFVVLSARLLAKDLFIVSRATDESTIAKLQKAGANRVIPLFETSATKMVQLLLNPEIAELLDVFRAEGTELELAEIEVEVGGPYVGQTLAETDLKSKNVVVVGIRRSTGEMLVPAPSDIVIASGDRIIAFGRGEAVAAVIE